WNPTKLTPTEWIYSTQDAPPTPGIHYVLQLPAARRLITEGGILWRIALQWGQSSVFQASLSGPSAQALHYVAGETLPFLQLFDDGLSSPTVKVLLGVQSNGYSLWPPTELLEHSKGWFGHWTPELESWFQQRAQAISAGTAKVQSISQWR
ncbi:hypothetical protein BDN72DRAFT_736530, partial [Pluteus cervinus]